MFTKILSAVLFLVVLSGNSTANESKIIHEKKVISLFDSIEKEKKGDRANMSTRAADSEVAYGCQNGFYICYVRNGAICCPNGSNCSVEGYCY